MSGVIVLVVVLMLGSGWYLSNLIRDGGLIPDFEQPGFDLEVAAIEVDTITLRITPDTDEEGDWQHEGFFGLVSEDGYDHVGEIVEISKERVVRRFIPVSDELNVGDMVRLDSFAFLDNPRIAHDLHYEEAFFSSPVGEFPAWYIPGNSKTWVIFVHGRNSHPRESLRPIPTIVDVGHPALVIHYRNDEDLPSDPSGFQRYGLTEWEDVEGAVRYAKDNGAEKVVLFGYSMGGGVVASFLYESELVSDVSGVILDSPMLNFGAVTDFRGGRLGYPQFLTSYAKAFASFRFDVDYEGTDYISRADELSVPILLFHGEKDRDISVETSDIFAAARPDIVRYIRVKDADHVRAWNIERALYEAELQNFLKGLVK